MFVLRLVAILICVTQICSIYEDNTRIKADNEPNMVSHTILQGVIEPFELSKRAEIPAWKQMKDAADHKAAKLYLSQALASYNQLLRHPYMFGDMPLEERYDVFVSMAKILKRMGFQQRAELLLYEAMGYTTTPHEAHYQLALLGLDKEELNEAKMHLKNCLFHRPEDVLILTHLSMVLIAEGKTYEAKFYLSQLLSALETRTKNWLRAAGREVAELVDLTAQVDQSDLARWLEEMMVRVIHGELQVTHSTSLQLIRMLSNLYTFIGDGELTGRFVFDIGQSLYEGGRPKVGHMMMVRGHNTSNLASEGAVSFEVVKMRLQLDYPVVPISVRDVIEHYLNITLFLSGEEDGASAGTHSDSSTRTGRNEGSGGFIRVDIENVLDIYWPVPLFGWAALPTAPLQRELLWRFRDNPVRNDAFGMHFLAMKGGVKEKNDIFRENQPNETEDDEDEDEMMIGEPYHPRKYPVAASMYAQYYQGLDLGEEEGKDEAKERELQEEEEDDDEEDDENEDDTRKMLEKVRESLGSDYSDSIKVLHAEDTKTTVEAGSSTHGSRRSSSVKKESKLLRKTRRDAPSGAPVRIEVGILCGHINAHPVGQTLLSRILGFLSNKHSVDSSSFRVTLLALMVKSDHITKKIASNVHNIVNLPLNKAKAWDVLQTLTLDIVLMPDWAPWPDSQVLMLANSRIAPIQACFHVRSIGSGCHGSAIDYYFLPSELEDSYLGPSPSTRRMSTTRPGWLEAKSEQVVLVDWPLLPANAIQELASLATSAPLSNHAFQNNSTGANSGGSTQPSRVNSGHFGGSGVSGMGSSSTSSRSASGSSAFLSTSLGFVPLEVEGQVFFEDQPSAILPCHPGQLHPLMDATIFKLMHAAPNLHLVLVLPRIYFASEGGEGASSSGNDELKISWARALVRRLWSKGGSLYHRIRLLPSPLNDRRMIQLFKQADMVLDSFPVGNPAHFMALALSVGTPVVTLRSGTVLSSAATDLFEVKLMLKARGAEDMRVRQHPLFQRLLNSSHPGEGDLPWLPSSSNVAGFYHRAGLNDALVASSASHYFALASKIATDREIAYRLRIAILDAIDAESGSVDGTGPHNDGLWRFLREVGTPWAEIRHEFLAREHTSGRGSIDASQRPSSSLRRKSKGFHVEEEGSRGDKASARRRKKKRKRASRTHIATEYDFDTWGRSEGNIITE